MKWFTEMFDAVMKFSLIRLRTLLIGKICDFPKQNLLSVISLHLKMHRCTSLINFKRYESWNFNVFIEHFDLTS